MSGKKSSSKAEPAPGGAGPALGAKTVARRLSQANGTAAVEGRKFTKREVLAPGLYRLDAFDVPLLADFKGFALDILEREGIKARAYLAQPDNNTSRLQDYVLNSLGKEMDSASGLAARIAKASDQMHGLLEAKGAVSKPAIANAAFLLGRLVTLARAYDVEDQQLGQMRNKAAVSATKYNNAQKTEWVELFRKDYSNFSKSRAAELIAARLELPEEAIQTIRKSLP